MLSGQWRDAKLGSGTDGRKLFDLYRAGQLTEEEWCEIEGGISRSAGHCTVMGTASHHDQPGRSARHDADRVRQHSRAGFAPPGDGGTERPAHRRDGARKTCGLRTS